MLYLYYVFKVYLIHIMDMDVIYSRGRNSFMNTSPWPIWLVTSQVVLCCGRQHLNCHYMNFLWIWVHAFYFAMLQLVWSFYSMHLKKVPEIVSFGPQTYVTPKGKGCLWVLQHCCLEAYCILTRMSSFLHLQKCCTHQAAWETSASEGRDYTWNLASNL